MYATKELRRFCIWIDRPRSSWSVSGHNAFVDPWMTAQRRFDLARFNPLAGQFDLIIRAAKIFEIAIGAVTRQVAGAKQPGAGIGAEGIDDEFFRSQFRPAPIAPRQAVAADIQFADDADRYGLALRIQKKNCGVRNRPANGHRLP